MKIGNWSEERRMSRADGKKKKKVKAEECGGTKEI